MCSYFAHVDLIRGFLNTCFHLSGCTGVWDLVSQPGIEPGPLHWELRILATGPPGKFQVSPRFEGEKKSVVLQKGYF